ncbi:MAG: HAD family hydrolase [Caloramator sp.]|nr:HAD family hydrolase [Caloramator sp.]
MNTILFDLDGTLLPIDMEIFEKEYFKRLCFKMKNFLSPEHTIKFVLDATFDMIRNTDSNLTNKQVFIEKFTEYSKIQYDIVENIIDDFYKNEYKTIGEHFKPQEYIIKSIEILKGKGYDLVVATNAIFPKEAIIDRLRWAGLNEKDFIFITSFEVMHFCKPNIKYYEEILSIINKKPQECLMVGNDVEEDLIASKIGVKTFLIKDNILNKKNIEYFADYEGYYEDFYNFVLNLPYAIKEKEKGA